MDDTYNKRLRQKVEEELQKALSITSLIKDEGVAKPMLKNLEQLKDVMINRKRLKTYTLEQCRNLVEIAQRKSFYKLVLELGKNCTKETLIEICGAETVEKFRNLESADGGNVHANDDSTPRTCQMVAGDAEQRLALKYPRKKIGTPDNFSSCSVSHGSVDQSSNALFKRRHEVFAPTPQPTTYAEHRRLLQLQEDAKKQNGLKIVKDVPSTSTNNDKSSEVPQKSHTDQMSVQRLCKESAPPHDPSCNNNHAVSNKSQPDNICDEPVSPEPANKSSHSSSASECPTKDHEPGNQSNVQAIENVEKPRAVKPNHKNKVNHRELHDLLSYTTEILPKLSRRKSISAEEEHNMQLLKQFGITKKLQIVLQRSDYGQIAQRTRSKSIDSMKYLENLDSAKQNVPVRNNTNQRRELKSMEEKKEPPTATTSKAKVKKPTARKSVSKSQNTAQPEASNNHRNGLQKVANNVFKPQEETKLVNLHASSKKRVLQSPSPPVSKRTRTSVNSSTNSHAVENEIPNIEEDSDEDEANVLAPNMVLKPTPQPNNDPNVHCHSDYMEKCCLCSYKGEHMVRHYVYNHPKKGVYISRVAPEQAQLIRADPFGISGKKAVSRYGDQEIIVFRCHFCDLRLSESQELWLDHISKHTGEYRYKCMLCPTFARLPIDRVTHHSVCTNPSMQLWHTYNFTDNHLYAYMCNKCNFVQVLFVNMKRHLREDHPEAGSIEIECTKFSLVNFNLHDEDSELPYGMVKLEPILDDTNANMHIKQELEPILPNDSQTQDTAPFKEIVQKQPVAQPEVIFIKQEILTDDTEACETNTTATVQQMNGGVTFRANVLQESSLNSYSVRVKKLPGDILSRAENNSPNKPSSNSNPVNHQLKHGTSNGGIADSRSTAKAYLAANQHTPASSMVPLQPWNGKDCVDKKMLLKSKLTDQFLIAPYKCTALNCGFYTDTQEKIGSHFQSHQKPGSMSPASGCDSSWLECSYCNYASLSIHNLLKHIDTVHNLCAYQCDRCCYRSRDPNSVRMHQRNYHSEEDADSKILCLSRLKKNYTSVDRDIIINEMRSNVKPLQCTYCSTRKFNDLEHYRDHLKTHGNMYIACHVCDQLIAASKMIGHISLHNIFMLQCVYCEYGINDSQALKKHIADNHANKWMCYHIRCSKPNVPSFIRVQDRISPERFVNC